MKKLPLFCLLVTALTIGLAQAADQAKAPVRSAEKAPAPAASIDINSLSLERTSPFDTPAPAPIQDLNAKQYGSTQYGAPAMIPHGISSYQMTSELNACLYCHAKTDEIGAAKVKGKPTAMPLTHWNKDAAGQLTPQPGRTECTLCHAPQADVDPLVELDLHGGAPSRTKSAAQPGTKPRTQSKTQPKAPATILHDISNFQATSDLNACLHCHAKADRVGAAKVKGQPTAMPLDHWTKNAEGQLKPQPVRAMCTVCHASHADAAPRAEPGH